MVNSVFLVSLPIFADGLFKRPWVGRLMDCLQMSLSLSFLLVRTEGVFMVLSKSLTLPVSRIGRGLGSSVQWWGSRWGGAGVNALSLLIKMCKRKDLLSCLFLSSMFIQKLGAPVAMVSRWERWQPLACWNCLSAALYARQPSNPCASVTVIAHLNYSQCVWWQKVSLLWMSHKEQIICAECISGFSAYMIFCCIWWEKPKKIRNLCQRSFGNRDNLTGFNHAVYIGSLVSLYHLYRCIMVISHEMFCSKRTSHGL